MNCSLLNYQKKLNLFTTKICSLLQHKLDSTLRPSKASSVERSKEAEVRDYRYGEKDERDLG